MRGNTQTTYNVSRQVLPGQIEVSDTSLIVHYQIHVDVMDDDYQTITSRTEQEQIEITFQSITELHDIEGMADFLIGKYEMLPPSKKSSLVAALTELRRRNEHTSTTGQLKQSSSETRLTSAPNGRRESSPVLDVSPDVVEEMLRNVLQQVHWGKEKEVLEALSSLADLAQLDRNLTLIAQNDPLMNTLLNGMKKFATTSLPACIEVMSIFERMSYFAQFIEVLGKFKIGAMTLSLLHAQVALSKVAAQNLEKEKLESYLKSQNQLMKLIVSLLSNLSENLSTLKKMVNKDIIGGLCGLFDRKNAGLLVLVLRLLRRIALSGNWSDFPCDSVIQGITEFAFRWAVIPGPEKRSRHLAVLHETVELLSVMAFHPDGVAEIQTNGVFAHLPALIALDELKHQLVRFVYTCSLSEGSHEAFRNPDLLKLLIEVGTTEGEDRLIALVLLTSLSSDKECAGTISSSPVFSNENIKGIVRDCVHSTSEANRILLKMVRNIADVQPELMTGFDDVLSTACLQMRNDELILCDLFAIATRGKMSSERSKYFANQEEFVQLIIRILSNRTAMAQLHLEVIMFLGAVVLYSEAAQAFERHKIVDRSIEVFQWHENEPDIQSQCMFLFYRLVCHSGPRKAFLAHNDVVQTVVNQSASKNAVMHRISNDILDVLIMFDRKLVERFKAPRFEVYNHEWLDAIREQQC